MNASLQASCDYCREISRRRARNFYYGMKLVPEPKRSAQFALYAWMRLADDLADEAGADEAKTAALGEFRRTTHAVLAGHVDPRDLAGEAPLWPAFADMAQRHAVPHTYFDAMIDGQLLDQTCHQYPTFEALYDYCYKVASVVGLACIEIWGYDSGEETRQLAEWRGIAFQLTNILRDVKEDAAEGRVYLPAEDFEALELKPVMFQLGNERELAKGLTRVVERARDYYDRSAKLDRSVHQAGRPCLWAMTKIYRGLLDKIAADPLRVLRPRRVRLASAQKGWIALRATMKGKVGV